MSTKKNLTTKTTIENLAAELKKKFAATDARLSTAETNIAAAFKSGKVDGNTVTFYTSADKSGTPVFTMDFPVDMVLDQAKTNFVGKFTWSEETYPGSTNPNLNNKPVMVLAVKGEGDTVSYSFLNMATLVDTYTVKTEGKHASTTIEISGYEVEVKVNISAEEGNQLQLKADGLYVPAPATVDLSDKADKVAEATAGNFAGLDANGNLTDSGKKPGDFVEKVMVEGVEDPVIHASDITDYTAEEIAALLGESQE